MTITNLSAGTYDVTVTDANGCSAVGWAQVGGPHVNTSYEWIEAIHLNGFNNVSGDNGGYADFANLSTNLATDEHYLMTLVPGYTNSSYREYWSVYIDYNQDGVYDHPSELALQTNGYNSETGWINIPSSALNGTTTMRVIMSYDWYRHPCDDDFDGEVEDYTIHITTCDNVTDGGDIGEDETLCPDNNDPSTIVDVIAPSGGSGAIEYIWLKNTTTTSSPPPGNGWQEITGANGPSDRL